MERFEAMEANCLCCTAAGLYRKAIADREVHRDEPFQRSWRPVTLHGSFPFSNRQMAILSSIVGLLVRPMVKGWRDIRLCCAIGAQLRQDLFENKAMLIERAPELELSSSDGVSDRKRRYHARAVFPQLHAGSG
jgi:hypothetical protein